jgi:hypothetical protein
MTLIKHKSLVKLKGLVKFKGLVKAIGLIKAIFQPPAIDKAIQWLGKLYQDVTTNLWYQVDQIGDRLGPVYLGSYLDMNGTDNYVDLGVITRTNNNIHIELRDLYWNSSQLDDCFYSEGNSIAAGDRTVFVGVVSGTKSVLVWDNAGSQSLFVITDAIPDDQWFDLIVDYDGSNLAIIDGDGNDIYNFPLTITIAKPASSQISVGRLAYSTPSFLHSGYIGSVINEIGEWYFDEKDGASVFGTKGIVGTLLGTLTAIRQESSTIYSYINEFGYNDNAGQLIPASQLNPNEDVLGNPLVNKGQVRLDAQLVNSNIVVMNGTDNFLSFSDLTGITIVSFEGTAVPTKSGNNINYTAGTVSYLELSNGSYYTFAEGAGIHYDKSVNGLDATPNGTLTSYYDTNNEVRPHNLIDGFDLWQNDGDSTYLYVPFDSNGDSIKTDGDAIVGYTWVSKNPGIGQSGEGHNRAETQYLQPALKELIDVANVFAVNPWYDGSNIPIPCDWETIANDYEDAHQWFADVFSKYPIKFNWIVYSEALSGDDLNKIYEFVNSRFFATDADGDTAIDADGDSAYDTN